MSPREEGWQPKDLTRECPVGQTASQSVRPQCSLDSHTQGPSHLTEAAADSADGQAGHVQWEVLFPSGDGAACYSGCYFHLRNQYPPSQMSNQEAGQ